MRTLDRGGLVAVIDTPNGDLTVASYHPHPNRYPTDKAADFARLVADLTGPLAVCGDLNCISPDDAIDRQEMVAAFRRFASNPEAAINQFMESGRQVFFSALGRFGLTDAISIAERRYSMPTDLISLNKSSAMRIDHILASDGIEVVAGEVAHSTASNQASDHHPVMLEFRVHQG
jgi:endonuclease/exonuclease/phosphatase family metal-dependent hydrolase